MIARAESLVGGSELSPAVLSTRNELAIELVQQHLSAEDGSPAYYSPTLVGALTSDLTEASDSTQPTQPKATSSEVLFSNRHAVPYHIVNAAFGEEFERASQRLTSFRGLDGEIWRYLHIMFPVGRQHLVEEIGQRSLTAEMIEFSSAEKQAFSAWALKEYSPSAGRDYEEYGSFLFRTVRNIQPVTQDFITSYSELRPAHVVDQQRPLYQLPEGWLKLIEDEDHYKSSGGRATYLHDVRFGDFIERMETVYAQGREEVLALGDQGAQVTALNRAFIEHVEEAVASVEIPEGQEEIFAATQEQFLNELGSTMAAYQFSNYHAGIMRPNALLVENDYLETLAYDKPHIRLVAHGGVASVNQPYVSFWHGDRQLVTIVGSSVPGAAWMHVDTVRDKVSDEQVLDTRAIIENQVKNNE